MDWIVNWMSPELRDFFKYWSLTFAVLIFYAYAMLVAGFDLWDQLMETVRQRRAQLRPTGPMLDPNPLKGRTIAETIGGGPGQRPDPKRQWLLDRARRIADRLGTRVQILVLEDNREHLLVQITDGRRLSSYRIDKTQLAAARTGDGAQEAAITDLLERYLAADFLGRSELRPQRTTELAREAASKAAPGPAARAGAPAPGQAGQPAEGA